MTLESLFATVLQLSFYGTIGCGVILVCALVNYARAPRWISMTLWGLVALRLIVPFHFSSAVSLFRLDGISDLSSRIDRTLDDGGAYRTALEGVRNSIRLSPPEALCPPLREAAGWRTITSGKTAESRRQKQLMRPFLASERACGLPAWLCCGSGQVYPMSG